MHLLLCPFLCIKYEQIISTSELAMLPAKLLHPIPEKFLFLG